MSMPFVEVFGLQLRSGRLVARRVEALLDDHPDITAARSIGLVGATIDGIAVLHSTSWRWEPGRRDITLTYLCAPDPGSSWGEPDVVVIPRPDDDGAADPSRPSPGMPSLGAVLEHGLGHLAWLAEHHPALVAASRSEAPGLWEAILAARLSRAGQLPHAHEFDGSRDGDRLAGPATLTSPRRPARP